MRKHIEPVGFGPPIEDKLRNEKSRFVFAELIAIAGLMLGTAVAAIVVSAGIAHADTGARVTSSGINPFAVVLLISFIVLALNTLRPRRR